MIRVSSPVLHGWVGETFRSVPQTLQNALRPGLLAERLYGRCFVVLHIEDCVELRDLQQVVDSPRQVHQFQFASLFLGSGEGADEFADTGAVDIVHVAHVQQDSFQPFGKQIVHRIAQSCATFTADKSAANVDNRDAIHLMSTELHARWEAPPFIQWRKRLETL